jgi:AcrR family transcriptional regulator
LSDQELSSMTHKSSRRRQESNSLDSEKSERARIVAAFMGLLVEQSIKKSHLGQIAAGARVSLAQLRDEFGSTIAVLAAHVEQIERTVVPGENVQMAESAHGLAMLLTSVLRAWLAGEDPDLARTMSALDRVGVWTAPRGLPRPGLPRSGLRRPPAPAAPAPCRRGHGGGKGPDAIGAPRSSPSTLAPRSARRRSPRQRVDDAKSRSSSAE